MTSPDTIQGVELPNYDDPPAIPDDLRVVFYALMSRAVPRFSNTAARDMAYPSPTDGQMCTTGSGSTLRMWVGIAGEWVITGFVSTDVWQSANPHVAGYTTITFDANGAADLEYGPLGFTPLAVSVVPVPSTGYANPITIMGRPDGLPNATRVRLRARIPTGPFVGALPVMWTATGAPPEAA